ncbi:Uncharacterised protein [Bordetella pertussis]|nr:Uncharacterised protein [Bordetella pertussis]
MRSPNPSSAISACSCSNSGEPLPTSTRCTCGRLAINGRSASISSRCPLVARMIATHATTTASAGRPSSSRSVERRPGGGRLMGE